MKESSELLIERANSSELPLIRSLAEDIWPSAYGEILTSAQITYMLDLFYSEESLAKQYLTHHFLLARIDGQAIGFASFSKIENTAHAKLHKLYVMPGLQGSGTGKKLLQAVINAARHEGSNALELNVNRHNKAIGFYEKNGFSVLREEDIDIGAGYQMNDFVMIRQIYQAAIV